MTINLDDPNTTIQIIFTAPEWETVVAMRQRSAGEFRNLLKNWLQGAEASLREELRSTLSTKLAKASDQQLLAAKQALGA